MKISSLSVIKVFDDAEWSDGIDLSRWLERVAPEIYDRLERNVQLVHSTAPSAEEERRDSQYDKATKDAASVISRALRSGPLHIRVRAESAILDDWKTLSHGEAMKLLRYLRLGAFRPAVARVKDSQYELRVFRADLIPEEVASQERKSRRGGRPSKWDWDGATAMLIERANTPDGLPELQADIERLVSDWFVENSDSHPAESGIRKYVSKVCGRVLDKARN